MRLVVYVTEQTLLERLNRLAGFSRQYRPVQVLRNLTVLHSALRRSPGGCGLLLLLIASVAELKRVVRLADLLEDQRIILVLPNRDRKTVALGHRLYPRFISCVDGDLQDVDKVMAKMIEHFEAQNSRC